MRSEPHPRRGSLGKAKCSENSGKKVFREADRVAGVRHVVEKGDCPWVGITEHPAADGSTIVMAINFEPREIVCPITVDGRLGRIWRGAVGEREIRLAPSEAELFEVFAPAK